MSQNNLLKYTKVRTEIFFFVVVTVFSFLLSKLGRSVYGKCIRESWYSVVLKLKPFKNTVGSLQAFMASA